MIFELNRSADESERALWAAEATRHDEVAAEASVMLVGVVGYLLRRPEEGERWGRHADAILARMGSGHDRLEGWLAQNRGRCACTLARWRQRSRSCGPPSLTSARPTAETARTPPCPWTRSPSSMRGGEITPLRSK